MTRFGVVVASLALASVLSGGGGARADELAPGDPQRGRTIVLDRHVGLCLLCHAGPFPDARGHGDLGPDLTGVGSRYTRADLRQRLIDPASFNPRSIMPSYARVSFNRAAPAFAGKPLLDDRQIEDVVAYLATLRAPEDQ